jgi:hypothetical protein
MATSPFGVRIIVPAAKQGSADAVMFAVPEATDRPVASRLTFEVDELGSCPV